MESYRLSIAVVLILLLASWVQDAIGATGFLKGERTQGMSKICFYDVLGDTHTINISSVSLCPQTREFNVSPNFQRQRGFDSGGKLGFLVGERTQNLSKICYYDVLGETYALTIGAVQICPQSHRF